jgi:hypothetical protein
MQKLNIMKKIHLVLFAGFLVLGNLSQAQETKIAEATDSTGLPGDNFNLQGALSLFKEAKNLEEFEKQLNDEKTYVNNLDLDEDGKTDYILVSDKTDGSSHAIVLQVAVNEKENQDIAVIEIEKTGEEKADLQIIGDEDIYGEKKIVEPAEEKEINIKSGPAAPSFGFVIVNVWFWPCVKFIYAPVYKPWISPWYWRHYPPYWKPWKPSPWHIHHNHCKPYYPHFRYAPKHRVVMAHKIYTPHRRSSVVVVSRHKPAINHYRDSHRAPSSKPSRVTRYGGANNVKNQKATYAPRSNGKKPGGNKGNSGSGRSRVK